MNGVTRAHVKEALAVAKTARQEAGLGLDGPVHDLLPLVEEVAGLPVAILAFGTGVAGAYVVRRGEAFVFLNGNDDLARMRFTLAHEFGHHRLGHGSVVDGVETIDGAGADPKEEQANHFAGEFLAPATALRSWMDAHDDPALELDVVVAMAQWFAVSTPAMLTRLVQADVLQRPAEQRRLRKAVGLGTHKGIERVYAGEGAQDALAIIKAEGAIPRLPAKMRTNALAAYGAGLIDLERLAALMRRDVDTARRLVEQFGIVPPTEAPDW